MSCKKKRNTAVEQAQYNNTKITLDKFPSLSKKIIPAKQEGVKNIMEGKNDNAPEHVRVGSVEVAIWTNNAGKGDYNTITMQRSYKDKEDKWQKTNSLRPNDIPKAILALQKAYEKIVLKE